MRSVGYGSLREEGTIAEKEPIQYKVRSVAPVGDYAALTQAQKDALQISADRTCDSLDADISAFREAGQWTNWRATTLGAFLKPSFAAYISPMVLGQFKVAIRSVVAKTLADEHFQLASTAEEIALWIAGSRAEADLGDLLKNAYQDQDFRLLFDQAADDFDRDKYASEHTAVTNLNPEEWFTPFWPENPDGRLESDAEAPHLQIALPQASRRKLRAGLAVVLWIAALSSILLVVRTAQDGVVGLIVAYSGLLMLLAVGGLASWRAAWKRADASGSPTDATPRWRRVTPLKIAAALGIAIFAFGTYYTAAIQKEADAAACKEGKRFWIVEQTKGYPASVLDLLAKADDMTLRTGGEKMKNGLAAAAQGGTSAGEAEFSDGFRTFFRRCRQLGFLPGVRVP